MNKRMYLMAVLFFCFGLGSIAQTQADTVSLSTRANFHLVNRNINIINEAGRIFVHLDAKPGEGIAWVNRTNFATGTIEFEVKGKDVMQQSFVGIAFHGVNDSTYDGIYFRPFNFQSTNSVRKSHSVQYISMPKYDWDYLREKFPGEYENKLTGNIQPDQWFHAKIEVNNKFIKVFVNNDDTPCLVVTSLIHDSTGDIGFWVGNNSDGYFSDLIIKLN